MTSMDLLIKQRIINEIKARVEEFLFCHIITQRPVIKYSFQFEFEIKNIYINYGMFQVTQTVFLIFSFFFE